MRFQLLLIPGLLALTSCRSIDPTRVSRLREARENIIQLDGRLADSLQILLYAGRIQHDPNLANCALDGCLEIVGEPDATEKILAANLTLDEVKTMRQEALRMRTERDRLRKLVQGELLRLEQDFAHCFRDHQLLRKFKSLAIYGGIILLVLFFLFRPFR